MYSVWQMNVYVYWAAVVMYLSGCGYCKATLGMLEWQHRSNWKVHIKVMQCDVSVNCTVLMLSYSADLFKFLIITFWGHRIFHTSDHIWFFGGNWWRRDGYQHALHLHFENLHQKILLVASYSYIIKFWDFIWIILLHSAFESIFSVNTWCHVFE